ncbi:MAG: ribosome silencing factor [Phycisphaeraceae bacterium]|nr:ribosome silencing factor [Phycisphaeraceae bacterium]
MAQPTKKTRTSTARKSAGARSAKGSRIAKSGAQASATTPAVNRGEALARAAARALLEDKCTDVVVIDVRGSSQVADYIVVASGTSDRQMRTAAEGVKKAASALGDQVVRSNLDERTTWVVLDLVDVMVHIFEPNTRAFYDLEMLWGDAPRLDLSGGEPAGRARARAGGGAA